MVRDNDICRRPTGPCDNDGIRLEPGVHDNAVIGNVVMGTGGRAFRALGGTGRRRQTSIAAD